MPKTRTIGLVKPEAATSRMAILDAINASGTGLTVIGHSLFVWKSRKHTEETVRSLYSSAPREIVEMTINLFHESESVALLIKGENAVEKFLALAGTEMDPNKCGPETLRFHFGSKAPLRLKGDLLYWRNAIHRPKNADEAARNIRLFFP